jgi:superfamily II DNA/RNA helicase
MNERKRGGSRSGRGGSRGRSGGSSRRPQGRKSSGPPIDVNFEQAPKDEQWPDRFADLGLSDGVVKSLDALGYESPTEIQGRTIPRVLAGRDVIGQANTGYCP